MSCLYLPTPTLPETAAMLRAVFGEHRVPLQRKPVTELQPEEPFTHMEAALLGMDYTKLLIAGNAKLPVLTLVGEKSGTIGLFLTWLKKVVGIRVLACSTMEDVIKSTANSDADLLVADLDGDAEHLTLLDLISSTSELCLYPNDAAKHQHVTLSGNMCLRCSEMPVIEDNSTTYWVRTVKGVALTAAEAEWKLMKMRAEYAYLLQLMHHPFLTKPTTDLWFAPELIQHPTTA